MPIFNTEYKSYTVTPVPTTLTYDFTQSDGWRIASSWTNRDSSWFYRNNTWSDGNITAPNEIFVEYPSKITITYVKSGSSSWTNFQTTWYSYNPSPEYNKLNYFDIYSSGSLVSSTQPWNATWNVTWEMVIDKSTSPRTVTHSLTGLTPFSESTWVLKNIWDSNSATIRIVNWYDWGKPLCITWVAIEY